MDILTYILCTNLAKSAVSGIKGLRIDGTDLIITTADNKELVMNFPTPKDGNSVSNIEIEYIDEIPHLIFYMSDGSSIDGGEIPSPPLKWGRLE